MSRLIILDTGVLGKAVHTKANPDLDAWLERRVMTGARVCIPEIADYELRRKLLHLKLSVSLGKLEQLEQALEYIRISTEMMRRAAELWAEARKKGHVTAIPEALDADVILAAQSLVFGEEFGESPTVATDNVRHLDFFLDARHWDEIH